MLHLLQQVVVLKIYQRLLLALIYRGAENVGVI